MEAVHPSYTLALSLDGAVTQEKLVFTLLWKLQILQQKSNILWFSQVLNLEIFTHFTSYTIYFMNNNLTPQLRLYLWPGSWLDSQ
jgi:hypothetical protein